MVYTASDRVTAESQKAAVLCQLETILSSPPFCHAERMKRFLDLVVRETLAGRAGQVKEYTIGVDAFGRPRTYSPFADPIVRVEARRLRDKLARYYEQHGQNDEIVIAVPRGQYLPTFTFRAEALVDSSVRDAALTVRPFIAVPSRAPEVSEVLFHELVDQFVRLHGVRVRTGTDELCSTWLLTGCIQTFASRTRVLAHLTSAPHFVCRWSTAVTSDASNECVESLAALIASRIVEYVPHEQAPLGSASARCLYHRDGPLGVSGGPVMRQKFGDGVDGVMRAEAGRVR